MPNKDDDDSEKDSSEKDKWSYQGDEDEWETFDRRIKRYCEKKYDLLGEALWYGTLPVVASLDPYDFYQYACGGWQGRAVIPSDQSRVARSFSAVAR